MPDTRLLAPILTPAMTEEELQGVAEVILEWAGVEWHQATVDDLLEARFHQQLYLDALENARVQQLAEAGVVALDEWRKGKR